MDFYRKRAPKSPLLKIQNIKQKMQKRTALLLAGAEGWSFLWASFPEGDPRKSRSFIQPLFSESCWRIRTFHPLWPQHTLFRNAHKKTYFSIAISRNLSFWYFVPISRYRGQISGFWRLPPAFGALPSRRPTGSLPNMPFTRTLLFPTYSNNILTNTGIYTTIFIRNESHLNRVFQAILLGSLLFWSYSHTDS